MEMKDEFKLDQNINKKVKFAVLEFKQEIPTGKVACCLPGYTVLYIQANS